VFSKNGDEKDKPLIVTSRYPKLSIRVNADLSSDEAKAFLLKKGNHRLCRRFYSEEELKKVYGEE